MRSWSGPNLTLDSIVGLRGHRYTYGLYDQVTTVERNGVLLRTLHYDNVGRLDSVEIANFSPAIVHHTDARGRDTLVIDMQGHETRYVYESLQGNLERVVQDSGQTTTWTFDAYGRVSREITPMSDTTSFTYDLLNRTTEVLDPENANPTETHYGPIYVDSITDPKGERYRFTHNALGWVTERYGPASARVADLYGYDEAGNVVTWTNRNG